MPDTPGHSYRGVRCCAHKGLGIDATIRLEIVNSRGCRRTRARGAASQVVSHQLPRRICSRSVSLKCVEVIAVGLRPCRINECRSAWRPDLRCCHRALVQAVDKEHTTATAKPEQGIVCIPELIVSRGARRHPCIGRRAGRICYPNVLNCIGRIERPVVKHQTCSGQATKRQSVCARDGNNGGIGPGARIDRRPTLCQTWDRDSDD